MSNEYDDRADELRAFGFWIEDDVRPPNELSELAREMAVSPSEPTRVYNSERGEWFDSDQIRSTHHVQVSDDTRTRLTQWIHSLLPGLQEHFGVALTSTEPLWFLRYREGDHFAAHRDAEEGGHGRQASRKVSLVFFVNDASEYSGGELLLCPFDVPEAVDLAIDLRPRAGRLVAFRSSTVHQVRPVTSGERFSVVTWAS
jgi:predicted 2-oxoglutarate/Fe(II)-dependent dioxygenase YbiX